MEMCGRRSRTSPFRSSKRHTRTVVDRVYLNSFSIRWIHVAFWPIVHVCCTLRPYQHSYRMAVTLAAPARQVSRIRRALREGYYSTFRRKYFFLIGLVN